MKNAFNKKTRLAFLKNLGSKKASIETNQDLLDDLKLEELDQAIKKEDSDDPLAPPKIDIEKELEKGMIISFGHDKTETFMDLVSSISKVLKDRAYIKTVKTEFDQELSNAIIHFQAVHNLNQNGQIDYELYQKVIKEKDVIIEKSESEKRLDRSMTGENYSVGSNLLTLEEKKIRERIFGSGYNQSGADHEEESEEKIEESKYEPNQKFDISSVSSGSNIPPELIEAFIKGESGGNPTAKAFNGDNYCNNLGWNSSSKVEEFLSQIDSQGIKGRAYYHGDWHNVIRFAHKFNGTKKEYEKTYKPQGYRWKSGYVYYDTAYFSVHKNKHSADAFDLAYKIDPTAAVMATAWGKGQVMGKHLLKTDKKITTFSSGKLARDHFDKKADKASAEMFISWVKSAGRFPTKSEDYTSKAKQYGVEDALGKTWTEVANLAAQNPDKYGYFAFLTKRYYGAWDNVYAKRLQKNYKKLMTSS